MNSNHKTSVNTQFYVSIFARLIDYGVNFKPCFYFFSYLFLLSEIHIILTLTSTAHLPNRNYICLEKNDSSSRSLESINWSSQTSSVKSRRIRVHECNMQRRCLKHDCSTKNFLFSFIQQKKKKMLILLIGQYHI